MPKSKLEFWFGYIVGFWLPMWASLLFTRYWFMGALFLALIIVPAEMFIINPKEWSIWLPAYISSIFRGIKQVLPLYIGFSASFWTIWIMVEQSAELQKIALPLAGSYLVVGIVYTLVQLAESLGGDVS